MDVYLHVLLKKSQNEYKPMKIQKHNILNKSINRDNHSIDKIKGFEQTQNKIKLLPGWRRKSEVKQIFNRTNCSTNSNWY